MLPNYTVTTIRDGGETKTAHHPTRGAATKAALEDVRDGGTNRYVTIYTGDNPPRAISAWTRGEDGKMRKVYA